MRKFILLLMVCLSTEIFAQKSFFGVDAGVNIANQRYIQKGNWLSYHAGSGNAVKLTCGIFFHYDISSHIGVRLSTQYASLGYRSDLNSQYDVTINYLTVPLSFFYRLNKYFSVNGGPYLSFTFNNTKYYNGTNSTDITSVYHKNDSGLKAGIQFDVIKNLGVGVNYILGTKNIWLNDSNGMLQYYNRALQLTLIYKFKKPS